MNNKLILESLVMDLKRVAIGHQRKSFRMADRFLEEAIKRKEEVDRTKVKTYLHSILDNVEKLKGSGYERIGE